jgi:multidrug transporter EmrE-like cation transporter
VAAEPAPRFRHVLGSAFGWNSSRRRRHHRGANFGRSDQAFLELAGFVAYGSSLVPFGIALKRIDISVGFAVWSALEMVLITSIGILWFREAASPLKMLSLGLILIGVVTLNLSSGSGVH